MRQKQLFKNVFLFLAIILMVLPFMLTFNSTLTRLVETISLYSFIQEKTVPLQVYLVSLIIRPLGIDYVLFKDGIMVNGISLKVTWNCIGWQSMVLFAGSLIFALKGTSYTFFSKSKAVFLGLFGIFWVNIFRMSFTVWLATFSTSIYKIVFHDYLAAFIAIAYLLIFWWFSYQFILEEST